MRFMCVRVESGCGLVLLAHHVVGWVCVEPFVVLALVRNVN